jgi:hypothetical protein
VLALCYLNGNHVSVAKLSISDVYMSTTDRNAQHARNSFAGHEIARIIKQALIQFVRSEHVLATCILLIALAVFYRDVVFDGRSFLLQNFASGTMPQSAGAGAFGYPGESSANNGLPVKDPGANAWFSEPDSRRTPEIIANGEIPLWNPSAGLGEPMLADGISAALEPLQVMLVVIPDSFWPLAIDVQVLLRFFLAGFFTYLFVRRQGLHVSSGVFAGIGFMLSSYFVAYGNHPQFRLETLLPLALYSYDRLAEKLNIKNFLVSVLVVAWVIVASFPESGFLVLGMATLWYIYRSFLEIWEARFAWRVLFRMTGALILVVMVGVGLSAFFVLPLADNISTSLHIHDPGFGMLAFPGAMAVMSLLPGMLVGGWWSPHFYIIVVALALVGVVKAWKNSRRRRLIMFFGLYGVVFYLKIYGFSPVQWIGLLPGFNRISILKYIIPSLSLCFAVLAAFGVEAIINKEVSLRFIFAIFLLFALLIGFVLLSPILSLLDPEKLITTTHFSLAVIISLCLIVLLANIFKSKNIFVTSLLIALVIFEPLIWHYKIIRPVRYDPFTPPPFVDFLRNQDSFFRIFGFDGILYPNISTAYTIDDTRFSAALLSKRRSYFALEFLTAGTIIPNYLMQPGDYISDSVIKKVPKALMSEPPYNALNIPILVGDVSRMTGTENPFYLGKYFDLLGARYVLTTKTFPVADSINLLSLPNVPELMNHPPLIALQRIKILNDSRNAIFMHPPSKVDIPLLVPAGRISLQFGVGMNPVIWMQEPALGDGVSYRVNVIDQQGEHEVFNHYIDPKHNLNERAWEDFSVDMSPWSGQKIDLILKTDGGPKGDTQADWAFWSSPILHIQSEPNKWAQQSLKDVSRIALNTAILKENMSKQDSSFLISAITIDQEKHNTLFMHPDNQAEIKINLPDSPTELRFSIAMDPNIWEKEIIGDGVTFRVIVKDSNAETEVFNRYIDPKHDLSERHWFDVKIDLSQWRGRSIVLQFATDSGPKKDNAADWAHWGDIEVIGDGIGLANPELTRFELIYDKEIQIYRDRFAYPRAFIVSQLEKANDINEAIRRLARSDFDPSTQAVVEGELPSRSSQAPANRGVDSAASAADIVERTTNTMRITTTLDKPGLLVVSESYDPGWQAYVDGQPTPVVPADGFLRGVYLDAGRHEVRFVYAPRSFTIGVAISITTLILLIAGSTLVMIAKRRKQSV